MAEDLFLTQYNKLNKGQKEAVDTVEGPTMVIAGPGTGKTTVLTLRIANILRKTDTPADGVLALTFTESGVVSMRRKLVPLIGPAAYRVGIFTFHGFAEEVIKKFPGYFPRIIGGDVATEAEKLNIIEQIIDAGEFKIIRPFGAPHHYVRGALHTISDLKRDAVSPDQFFDVLKKEEENILGKEDLKHTKGKYAGEMKAIYKDALKNIEKNRELGKLYEWYEGALRSKRLYDFDDMLLELLEAFKTHPDLLQSLQEEYLYFLADEHQDANNAQNSILESLSGYFEEPNLFIVGDEKQAIYRFQGASLENFLYFKNKFPTAKLIYLDQNYRSHQSILDVSHALAEPLPGDQALRPRLLSEGGQSIGKIDVVAYSTDIDEAIGLAESIKDEIDKGTPPEEISVLVRTNREITEIGKFLISAGIPTTLFQDEDVLADPDIQKLLLLLRVINNPDDDTLLAEVLFVDFLGLDPIEVTKLLHRVRAERVRTIDLLGDFPDFNELFKKWITLAKNSSALEVVTAVLADSDLQAHLLTLPDSIEKVAVLSTLYQEISTRQAHHKEFMLKDFLSDIDTLKEHGARLAFSSRLHKEHSVSVMTAHRSKGLEWKVVYIPHAVSGRWGSKRSMSDFRLPYPLGNAHQSGKEEDERRLFYVAITRAKERIVLSLSSRAADGKELVPSLFVEELPPDLVEKTIGPEISSSVEMLGALARRVSRENTLWDEDYIKESFLRQGLSATALNNYLECPWKFFFKNLICLPEMMEKQQMYGTAMHAALAEATHALKQEKKFTEKDLVKAFVESLSQQPLTQKDFEEAKEKGETVLKTFWKSEKEVWHVRALPEFNVSGVLLPLEDGKQLLLKGRMDKIDLLDTSLSKNRESVRVIDFKTGRPKSRNEILGETKSGSGNEKRQLDFYRLLLDLYNDGKYEMTEGVIWFTEPDEKGRIKKEVFTMSIEDADKVRAEALMVAEEVLSLSFWDKDCGDKDCEFCNLRKVLIA